jgi:hypothetical protein
MEFIYGDREFDGEYYEDEENYEEFIGKIMCGMCYDFTDILYPTKCVLDESLDESGMYHCPDCGMMLIGKCGHPGVCEKCYNMLYNFSDVKVENHL